MIIISMILTITMIIIVTKIMKGKGIKNSSNKIINIMVKMIEINKRQRERKIEISI